MTKTKEQKIISEYFARITKRGHAKSPRTKEHYRKMQAASVKARLAKKLSTGTSLRTVSKRV